MELNHDFWEGRRVLLTGHTGFKGAWLALWLTSLGAHVRGIALEPEIKPGLLAQFGLETEIDHHIEDIRNRSRLNQLVAEFAPEVVLHLAAQAIVRRSYQDPVDTWETNVIGSINVMEALRKLDQPVAAVMVTTDKVYENREWSFPYREIDPLGGHDPYSSSKGAAEIAIAAWRRSFFENGHQIAVASARAGNVIGGGDYSEDRIVPDIVRSIDEGKPVGVRNPQATRPWQHVLEPLSGYLMLAERLRLAQQANDLEKLDALCSPWNFGPLPEGNHTVQTLVETCLKYWPGQWESRAEQGANHEANFLGLTIDKATRQLDWYPRWSFEQSVETTMNWYRQVADGGCPRKLAMKQINQYQCNSQS